MLVFSRTVEIEASPTSALSGLEWRHFNWLHEG
jgi:hypothetical protein